MDNDRSHESTALAVIERDPVAAIAVPSADPRPYRMYLLSLKSAESRRAMAGCLNRIAGWYGLAAETFPWDQVGYEEAMTIRAVIMNQDPRWSPSHVNKHLTALRRIVRQCWLLGLIPAETRMRIEEGVEGDDGQRLPAGRNLGRSEIDALRRAAASDPNRTLALRDTTLLMILVSTGLRRAEAAGALTEKYDPRERQLKVIGKRDKEREVYLTPRTAEMTGCWLSQTGARRGPLLRAVDRYGNISAGPMSPRSVGRVVDARREQAGLQAASTHDFRRTFGGDFLDSGGDLVQLQRLFGHASATTTAGYDRRPARALRAAVDKLELPAPDPAG